MHEKNSWSAGGSRYRRLAKGPEPPKCPTPVALAPKLKSLLLFVKLQVVSEGFNAHQFES